VINVDMNITNVSETDNDKAGNLETHRNEEHNDSGSLKEKGESGVQSNEEMVDNATHISVEEKVESPVVQWKNVRRKNKGSSKENGKKVDELKNKNSFESLLEVNEDLSSGETFVSQSNNIDQHNEDAIKVDDCVESNEDSEYETDNEETCVEKFKPIEEVSEKEPEIGRKPKDLDKIYIIDKGFYSRLKRFIKYNFLFSFLIKHFLTMKITLVPISLQIKDTKVRVYTTNHIRSFFGETMPLQKRDKKNLKKEWNKTG
ncbi:hypothetical protein MKX03_018087, partial [Papaver bracteatum]